MVGTGLKKLAEQHGMKIAQGVAYGDFYGYATTFSEGSGWKRIAVSTRFPEPGKRAELQSAMAQHNLSPEYRVKTLDIFDDGIVILFLDNPGTMKKIEAFCQWFFPQLSTYSATGIDTCGECGLPLTEGGCWTLLEETAYHLHAACAQKLSTSLEAEAEQRKLEDTGSYGSGLIGALIGAVLGAVLWGAVMQMGYVASIIGFVIGFLAEKGYTLLKGKRGKGKLVILIVATIFGVLLGNLGSEAVSWAREIALYAPEAAIVLENVEIPVSYGDIPMLILYFLANDAEYLTAMLSNCGLGLLFALLGVFGILRKTSAEVKAPKLINLE